MKKLVRNILLLFLFMVFIWPLRVVNAAVAPKFTVTPILPANQRQTVTGYFDLQIQPGQQEDLQLRIANQTDETQTYTLAANPAYTTNSGMIAFDQSRPSLDQNAIRLNTLIKGPASATIAAGSNQVVTYHLQSPSTHFIGIISGGFYILQKGGTAATSSTSGVRFTDQFAIGIPLILRQDLKTPNPPMLELTKASIGTANHYPVVNANIHNPSSNQFGEIATDYKLFPTGGNKAVLTGHFAGLAVAPHSRFTQSIPLNGKQLQAGSYTLKWTAKSGSYTWTKQVSFRYNGHLPTNAITSQPKTPAASQNNLALPWIIAGIATALLIIILGIWRWTVVRHKQNQ
ncbi:MULTISPECIES: DUF916 and DUF3324 domain-containing protein [Lacticaseibacillus]|nr:cell surface protein [Lacticaseibacillus casei]